jgi:DNA-directed RNA polymerase specialized sigma24 family protein
VSTELLDRARAGDGEAFRLVAEPYRPELQLHCYRMLGSLQDAEDALQDTMLAAWRGLAAFEGRSSLRTWLYQVATNRCLNILRAHRRRPVVYALPPGVETTQPTRTRVLMWLEPVPRRDPRWRRRTTRSGGSLRNE